MASDVPPSQNILLHLLKQLLLFLVAGLLVRLGALEFSARAEDSLSIGEDCALERPLRVGHGLPAGSPADGIGGEVLAGLALVAGPGSGTGAGKLPVRRTLIIVHFGFRRGD